MKVKIKKKNFKLKKVPRLTDQTHHLGYGIMITP